MVKYFWMKCDACLGQRAKKLRQNINNCSV